MQLFKGYKALTHIAKLLYIKLCSWFIDKKLNILAGIYGLNKQTPFQKVWGVLSLNSNSPKTELLCNKVGCYNERTFTKPSLNHGKWQWSVSLFNVSSVFTATHYHILACSSSKKYDRGNYRQNWRIVKFTFSKHLFPASSFFFLMG